MKRISSKRSSQRFLASSEAYVIGGATIVAISQHARDAFPREAAGLLIGRRRDSATALSVYPTPIDENTLLSFKIRDTTIRSVRERLNGGATIRGCFHSHLVGAARPSKHDRAGAQTPGDLWLIYSLRFHELKLYEWDGERFHRRRFRIKNH